MRRHNVTTPQKQPMYAILDWLQRLVQLLAYFASLLRCLLRTRDNNSGSSSSVRNASLPALRAAASAAAVGVQLCYCMQPCA
jgi:hypothetical protein